MVRLTCKDAKRNPKKKKNIRCKVAKDEDGNKLGAYFEFNGDAQHFYDDCAAGCSLGIIDTNLSSMSNLFLRSSARCQALWIFFEN